MIFDTWRLAVMALPYLGIIGAVVFVLGAVGDPKVIKNKKVWKKWGMILVGLTFIMIVIQMMVTYSLLLSS